MGLWTKDELVAVLREACAVVEEAKVPEDLRAQAFAAAVNGLATKQVPMGSAVPVDLSHLRRGS